MSSQLAVKKRQAVGITRWGKGFDILLLSPEFIGKHFTKHAHTTEKHSSEICPRPEL